MAALERIDIFPMTMGRGPKGLEWSVDPARRKLSKTPQIFFADGEPWFAANAYALDKRQGTNGNDPKTIISNLNHLKAYASWLETNGVDWREFPRKKVNRCLFRYRGFLIEQRDAGVLSPSTATARMGAVVRFYRWAQPYGWVERQELWEDKNKVLKFFTTEGFLRTMTVTSSELAIPNRKRDGEALEDGLLPLGDEDQKILLRYLHKENMVELYLMTLIACFTGARSETIRTLRVLSLENAVDDPMLKGFKRVSVGPGTQVKMKFDVSGQLMFVEPLMQELERYVYSARRLNRYAKAATPDKTLLFLTERGNGYSETTFTKLISYLREQLFGAGLTQFADFKFHQTRATFGTKLMRIAMQEMRNTADAIGFVKDLMLHKDESTTWKYIKFIQREPVKRALSEEFFSMFTGKCSIGDAKILIDQVVYDDAT